MRGDEIQALSKQKYSEGKDSERVNEEIETLKNSQIILKNNKIQIIHLQKDIDKLNQENIKLKEKIFNLQFKLDKTEQTKEIVEGNVRYLSRIMIILKKGVKTTQSEIVELCCTVTKEIKPCLHFLERYNLIKSEKIKGLKRYWIE